ncbi:MAG TPA: mechanosensitive ion channel family protein, partial [Gammaproteobacteria bacterium]|nr:mechanosensitive ion channel family protein [Gammaproteobacteria bacterium]
MLNDLQNRLTPYLELLGGNPWLQAAVVVVVSLLLAWIFDRVIASSMRKLASRTRMDFDDSVIDFLHGPVRTSVILLGLALAASLLKLQEPYRFVVFSALLSIAYLIWMLFLLRVIRSVLAFFARDERKLSVLHAQTLPLFDNLAMIVIVAIAVYMVFSAWGVDMTAWLASAGIVGIAVGFAAKDT